jgi:hypothetical protein
MQFAVKKNVVGMGVLATLAAAAIIGCDDRGGGAKPPTTSPPHAAAADALPPGLVLAEPPAGAKDVVAVKSQARPGDHVVVRGRVGGSKSPFVEGRASFQLVDASLKACGEGTPMDNCQTPWDYCCDEPKEIAAHSASVQVVGADGRPLRAGLSGVGGIKPLSVVTVTGTVAGAGDAGTLIINATGIYVGH